MKQLFLFTLAAGLLALLGWYYLHPATLQEDRVVQSGPVIDAPSALPDVFTYGDGTPARVVLDISVHTLDGLRVLFERAEELALRPQTQGEAASVVLVLHGPEVEFFSIRNYAQYKDIVDQAARLDAFDVVDVKICQTMMDARGIARDDIPSFIEQVPLGPGEISRLVGQGYVAF
jgi:hypothetical protein